MQTTKCHYCPKHKGFCTMFLGEHCINEYQEIVTRLREVYPINEQIHQDFSFWVSCADNQVWEMKESLTNGDYSHFYKELADLVLVGLDGLRKLGQEPLETVSARLEENSKKKNLSQRTSDFYKEKSERIRREINENQ